MQSLNKVLVLTENTYTDSKYGIQIISEENVGKTTSALHVVISFYFKWPISRKSLDLYVVEQEFLVQIFS